MQVCICVWVSHCTPVCLFVPARQTVIRLVIAFALASALVSNQRYELKTVKQIPTDCSRDINLSMITISYRDIGVNLPLLLFLTMINSLHDLNDGTRTSHQNIIISH